MYTEHAFYIFEVEERKTFKIFCPSLGFVIERPTLEEVSKALNKKVFRLFRDIRARRRRVIKPLGPRSRLRLFNAFTKAVADKKENYLIGSYAFNM